MFSGFNELFPLKESKFIYSLFFNRIAKCKSLEEKPSSVICIYNHRTTKTNQKYPSVNL